MSEAKTELTESEIYAIYYKTCIDVAVENKIISPLLPLVTLGIASDCAFGDFLLKGIYDPRLLVSIFDMAETNFICNFSEMMVFRHFANLCEDKICSQNTFNTMQDKVDNKKFVLELLRLDKRFTTSVINRIRIVTNEILLTIVMCDIDVHKWQNIKYLVTDIAESLVYNPIYLQFVPHLADKKHYETIFQHHGLWFIDGFDQKVYDHYVEYAKAHDLNIKFNGYLMDNYVGKILELSETNYISHATLKEMDNQIANLFISTNDNGCNHTILADVVIACDDCTNKIMNFDAKSCIGYSDIDTWFGEKKPYNYIITSKSHLLPYYMNVWNRLTKCNYANFIRQTYGLIRSILYKFDIIPYPPELSSWEEDLRCHLIHRPICTDYSFIVHENPRIKELAQQYDIYAIMKDLEKGINHYDIFPDIEFVDESSEFKYYYENVGKITYELLFMYAKKVNSIININDTIVRLYIHQRCAEIIEDTGVFPKSSYLYVEWLLNKCDNPANFAASILYSYCLCKEPDVDIVTYLIDFIADNLDVYRTSHAQWIELQQTISIYDRIPYESDFIMRRLFCI